MRYYRYGSDYGPKEFPNYEAVITYLRADVVRRGISRRRTVERTYL